MSQSAPTPATRTLWIVWASMLATLIVYAAIPFLVPGGQARDPLLEQAMLLGLFGVAAASAIGTLIARNLMIVQPAQRGDLDLGSGPALSRFASVSIALWAVAESIAVYGLVLYLLFGKAGYLHAFLLAAATLFAVHSPRAPAAARP
jgi:hypothetical protein